MVRDIEGAIAARNVVVARKAERSSNLADILPLLFDNFKPPSLYFDVGGGVRARQRVTILALRKLEQLFEVSGQQ
jgi:hypothetical protein